VVYGHDVFQRVFQPLEGIHFVFFADGEEGINHGGPLGGLMASCEEVVLSA